MSNFNLNKFFLGGRLTANPELKTTPYGVTVCNFTVAVNRIGAEDQEADFFRCTTWNKKAEFVSKFFTKGSPICVIGSVRIRSYTDNGGTKRKEPEVRVDEVLFVDGKNDNASGETGTQPAFNVATGANFVSLGEDEDIPFN